jgi:hypothetical protein
MFRNIDSINRIVLHKVRNTVGVSDLTFYESRCRLDGKIYILKILHKLHATIRSNPKT